MGAQVSWIMIAIAVVLVLFAIMAFFIMKARKGKTRPIDYSSWFMLGIFWVIIGLIWIEGNLFFLIMGLFFVVLSLFHTKEWKKNREANKWKNLSKIERKMRIITMIILLIVLLGLGIILLIY